MQQTETIILPSAPNKPIKLNIIPSRRRTMSLSIGKDASIIARVPLHYNLEALYRFIFSKSNWLIKHIREVEQNPYATFVIHDGMPLTLMGTTYTLHLVPSRLTRVVGLNIYLPIEAAKPALVAAIKRIAKRDLTLRTRELAQQFNFKYNSVRIGSAKTMRGSCNSKNDITFTYALMLTPYFVVDYVIIHELCHTRVKNHSKKFYAELASCMPNYKQAEAYLKENKGIINYI